MPSVREFLGENVFHKKLVDSLQNCLNDQTTMKHLLKLLIVVTFYDDGKITEELLELHLLKYVALLLEFVQISDTNIVNICILVNNICFNVPCPFYYEVSILKYFKYIESNNSYSL